MPVLATPVGSLPALFPDEVRFLSGPAERDICEGMLWCDEHRQELSLMGRRGFTKIQRFLIRENAVRAHNILRSFAEGPP
jgi:hypothetical protein